MEVGILVDMWSFQAFVEPKLSQEVVKRVNDLEHKFLFPPEKRS